MVDGLERELEGQADVVRLSVFSQTGREVSSRYGVMAVPTFLVFSGTGTLVGRHVGLPNREELKAMALG
jgi:hypothetical protein